MSGRPAARPVGAEPYTRSAALCDSSAAKSSTSSPPAAAARRQSTQRAGVGEQVAEAGAGARRRRRGDHVEVDGDRDRQAAVAAVEACRRYPGSRSPARRCRLR